ncbi:MAG: succinate dehydrogenase, cytochrome b556 subunit [Candidatus Eutrophobiaceae bacterium]
MQKPRPLSPHLQIYKPQLTSVLSITHRGTGIFTCLALIAAPFWLFSVLGGPKQYAMWLAHAQSWYGTVLITAFTFSFFYHLCNGIRHLFWDAGLGLDIDVSYTSGYLAIIFSILLSVATLFWL